MTVTDLAPSPHTRPDRPARGAGERYVSSFTTLTRSVKDAGLMQRAYGYYWTKFAILMVLGAGLVVAFIFIGDSWWQMGIAAALGLLMTQTAFMGHDAAHRQIFRSGKWNTWASLVMINLVTGMGHGWWNKKHNKHHAAPNQLGKDPDIGPGPVIWTGEALQTRTTRTGRWFARIQAYTFYPLLAFEGLSLHVQGVARLFSRNKLEHRWVEASFIAFRLGTYVALVFIVLPPGKAAAFIAIQMGLFGAYLGLSFAPNHVGMPIAPRGMKIDFLQRQVLMSRNITGGRWVDTFMGGLNFQVEHHLFPSMARPNLRKVAPMVREHCRQLGVRYTETTLFQSYKAVTAHIHKVGRGGADIWACPLAGQMRTA
ncbi:fatty acid desaturase family protein [Georgenia sp. Z1491]|uniref:fatty acid desaturase family protein n=1 Tax=Georgenia sp. Z1491 TaxID=3416707 RepID=UPI003CFA109F